jgi:hypothetical protein
MKKLFLLFFLTTLFFDMKAQFVKNDWGKLIGASAGDSTVEPVIYDIEADASGNVYTVGSFTGTVDFDPGPGVVTKSTGNNGLPHAFFAKYSNTGALVWVKTLGGINDYAWAYQLALDNTGDLYISGNRSGLGPLNLDPNGGSLLTGNNATWFLAKYDANGNVIWGSGTQGSTSIMISDLFINANNELVRISSSSSPAFAVSFFNKTTGASISAAVFTGTAQGLDINQRTDFYKAKQDASGNYVLCGAFVGGITDFDPGVGVTNLSAINSSTTNASTFVAKYNSAMALQWAFALGEGIYPHGIVTDATGNVYIAGVISDTIDFDPGAGVSLISPALVGGGLLGQC